MTYFLPMFPLELVVFPKETLRLHIFEPRYKALIQECEERQLHFGIAAFIHGRIAEYGTEVRLSDVTRRYESGELDIIVEGLRVFRIEHFIRKVPDRLYAGGEVSAVIGNAETGTEHGNQLTAAYLRLHELLHTQEKLDPTDQDLSFYMGHRSGLSLRQKIEMLSLPSEQERQDFLLAHLAQVIPVLEALEETRKRLMANGRFHKLPKLKF
ncbi:MAG: LON peptidase substrate-binding domain-containing protein [Candidatus Hydrogenedentes bacterium]|nr:LON peptidase substrate-binding domain-containing protein [Candidatus Hydrogenedentota bacterium]